MMREDGLDVDNIGQNFHMDGSGVRGDVKRNCSIIWIFNEDLLHGVRIGAMVNCSEEFMAR